MKQTALIACVVLLCLTACDNHDNEPNLPLGDNLIAFDAEVSTRGTVTTTSTITDFGVFCYYTGEQRWAEAGASTTPNKLFNTKVNKNSDAKWIYENPVKWTDLSGNEVGVGYFFHFFGYSPYSDASNSTNVTIQTSATTEGAPALTYRQVYNIGNQTDLLVASPIMDRMHIGNRVSIVFLHALSQIGFSACIADAVAGNTYTATELKLIYNTDYGTISRKATLDLTTLRWSDFDEPVDDNYEEYAIINNVALTAGFQNLQTDAGTMFFIPQEVQNKAITMSLTVQKKPTSGTTTSKTFENVPVPATLWELGKSYNYQYTISYETTQIALSSVNIVDWTTSSGGSMDIN